MNKLLYLPLFFLILSSCESAPGKQEARYNAVADSLRKYKSSLVGLETDTLRDYMRLDYHTYREKYPFNDAEMEQLAQTLEVTYQIGATMRLMEENRQLRNDYSRSAKDETDHDTTRGKYSFDQNLLKAEPITEDEGVEVIVLDAATYPDNNKPKKKK